MDAGTLANFALQGFLFLADIFSSSPRPAPPPPPAECRQVEPGAARSEAPPCPEAPPPGFGRAPE